nr:hypothetical protein [Leucobacter insecticola]
MRTHLTGEGQDVAVHQHTQVSRLTSCGDETPQHGLTTLHEF